MARYRALTRFPASLLFGVAANDIIVFIAAAALLAMVAVLSVLRPARRAAKLDPVVALRFE